MANKIGLDFNPYLNIDEQIDNGSMYDDDTSVPKTVFDYYNQPKTNLDWNPIQAASLQSFLNRTDKEKEEEKQYLNPLYSIDKWNKGYFGLSDDEKEEWLQKYPKATALSDDVKDVVWRNSQYVDVFGDDDFDSTTYEERKKKFKDAIVTEGVINKYDLDPVEDIDNPILRLTPEGKEELLRSKHKSDIALDAEKELIQDEWKAGNRTLEQEAFAVGEAAKNYAISGAGIGLAFGMIGGPKAALAGAAIDAAVGAAYGATFHQFWGNHDEDEAYLSSLDKKNNKILDKIVVKDNKRKKEIVNDRATEIYNRYEELYDKGVLSEETIDESFDDLALNKEEIRYDEQGNREDVVSYVGSNHYTAFKGSNRLDKFDAYKKLWALAQNQALEESYGKNDALSILDQDMQEYISKSQTFGSWTKNTGQNIIVGGVANIMNKGVGIGALATYAVDLLEGNNGERLAKYLSGENNGFLANVFDPQYWEKVDQYNTFSPKAIERADKTGGISKWNSIVRPGTEGDFFSTNTISEALKMCKFGWSDYLTNAAFGWMTRTGTALAKGVVLPTGKIAAESPALAKAIYRGGTAATVAGSSLGIDVAYGMQTFNEVLDENNRKIDAMIDADVERELQEILSSPNAQREFNNQIWAENERRRQEAAGKENKSWVQVDETEAWNDYVDAYRKFLREKHERLHADEREQARKDAAQAYAIDATIEAVRMAPINAMFRGWMFDKGTRAAIRANNPYLRNVVKDGLHTLEKTAENKAIWSEIGNNIFAGGYSNYFDDVTVAYAKDFEIADFNNYLLQKYNPAAYGSILDDYVLPFVAGMTGSHDALVDKRSLYDGAIGALGSPMSIAFKASGFRNAKDAAIEDSERKKDIEQWNKQVDEKGLDPRLKMEFKPESNIEKVSHFIQNPIIEAIANAKRTSRLTEQEIARVNKLMLENAASFDDIGTTIAALDRLSNARESGSVLQAEDAKDNMLFTLVSSLLRLKNNNIVKDAREDPEVERQQKKKDFATRLNQAFNEMLGDVIFDTPETSFTRALQALQDASEIQEETDDVEKQQRQAELIKTFKNLDENKSELKKLEATDKGSQNERITEERQNAFARERLKKNADALLSMMEKMENIQKKMENSITHPDIKNQLLFEYVMADRWKEREEELDRKIVGERQVIPISERESSVVAKYGSKENLEKTIEHQEKRVKEAEVKRDKAEKKLKEELPSKKDSARQRMVKKAVQEMNLDAAEKSLKKAKDTLKQMRKELDQFGDEKSEKTSPAVIKAEDILALKPSERLRMLDDFYRNSYSTEQQAEIDKAQQLLIEDGTPLDEKMEMVRDAAILYQRIEQNAESMKALMKNPAKANALRQALINNRRNQIVNFFNDKIIAQAITELDNENAFNSREEANAAVKKKSSIILEGVKRALNSRNINRKDTTDKSISDLLDAIDGELQQRQEASNKISAVKLYNAVNDRLDVTVPSTLETLDEDGKPKEQPKERNLSDNDRRLINYMLDYISEQGYANGLLDEDAKSQEEFNSTLISDSQFEQYVNERNHIDGVALDKQTNPMTPEYRTQLLTDLMNSYRDFRKKVEKAAEEIPVDDTPPTGPKPIEEEKPGVEKNNQDNKKSDEGGEKPTLQLTRQNVEKAVDDMFSNRAEADAIQKADKLKALLNRVEDEHFENTTKLIKRLTEKALMNPDKQELLKDIEALKDVLNNPSNSKQAKQADNNLLPSGLPDKLSTVSIEQLLRYGSVWENFLREHNVQSFINNYLAYRDEHKDDEEIINALNQAQVLFVYDPQLAANIKTSMEKYDPAQVAPILMVLQVDNYNNDKLNEIFKEIGRDLNHTYSIKHKDKSTSFQVIGALPASNSSHESAFAASKMREFINFTDDKPQLIKNGNKAVVAPFNKPLITAKASDISYSNNDVSTLMMESARHLFTGKELDELEAQQKELNEKSTKKEKRNTDLWKKLRNKFVEIINVKKDNRDNKTIFVKKYKGTKDTYDVPILTKPIEETYDRNSDKLILDLFKELPHNFTSDDKTASDKLTSTADQIISSNSRIKRLYDGLNKFIREEVKNINDLGTFRSKLIQLFQNYFNVVDADFTLEPNSSMNPTHVVFGIKSGNKKLASLEISLNGTELSKGQYAYFLENLFMDENGAIRTHRVTNAKTHQTNEYNLVKWQTPYNNVESKSEEAKNEIKDWFDDGTLYATSDNLGYSDTRVQVQMPKTLLGEQQHNQERVEPTVTNKNSMTNEELKELREKTNSIRNSLPAAIRNVINRIINNSRTRKLNSTEDSYIIGGKEHARVTSIKHLINTKIKKYPQSNGISVALEVGDSFDDFARDATNGLIEDETLDSRNKAYNNYANSTPSNYEKAYQALKAVENLLLSKKQAVVQVIETDEDGKQKSGQITAQGVVKVNKNGELKDVRIAGTVDMLTVDEAGDFYLYDFKTTRSTSIDIEGNGYDIQLSLYAKFLEDEYGIKIKDIYIIPAYASYTSPNRATYEKLDEKDKTNHQLKKDGELVNEVTFDVKNPIPVTRLVDENKLTINYNDLDNASKKSIDDILQQQEDDGETKIETKKVEPINKDNVNRIVKKEKTVDGDKVVELVSSKEEESKKDKKNESLIAPVNKEEEAKKALRGFRGFRQKASPSSEINTNFETIELSNEDWTYDKDGGVGLTKEDADKIDAVKTSKLIQKGESWYFEVTLKDGTKGLLKATDGFSIDEALYKENSKREKEAAEQQQKTIKEVSNNSPTDTKSAEEAVKEQENDCGH